MNKRVYCVNCGDALMNFSINNKELYFCTLCGAALQKLSDGKYRFLGTFFGNRNQREVVDIIKKIEGGEKV